MFFKKSKNLDLPILILFPNTTISRIYNILIKQFKIFLHVIVWTFV